MDNSVKNEFLTMDEVEEALNQIDLKFTKYQSPHDHNALNENLFALIQDFDSLGLPEIDPSLPAEEIHKRVVKNSHLLVEMYRRSLNQLNENELNCNAKNTKNADLQKKLYQIYASCEKLEHKNKSLEIVIRKLKNENTVMKDTLITQKSEMQKVKLYYSSKQNELQHSIRKLEKNNQDLKDMFGQDVSKYLSKDEIVANYVKKCKLNEEIYKTTIKELQQKNDNLMRELIRLSEH
ncbi:hypothetical protein WA026_012972 [Henosepilachna vigintioctopunctata]|uniref:Uncharacterized protein n=1 Tax=Henosepilachna vigintioctopunctata TaxID=420089 RepID=A0AAW1TU16_9CUCU